MQLIGTQVKSLKLLTDQQICTQAWVIWKNNNHSNKKTLLQYSLNHNIDRDYPTADIHCETTFWIFTTVD